MQVPSETLPSGAEVRLVVTDMDGTLLDEHGRVPEALWPLLDRMRQRGVVFAPASGRQYATLHRMFERAAEGMPFIAENGSYVVRDGLALSAHLIDRAVVERVVASMRALAKTGPDLGVVLCGVRSAYVERTDAAFVDEASRYYARLETVEDLLAVDDAILKLALFDFGDAASELLPSLEEVRETHQVVVSGEHWIDVMDRDVNKGVAVRELQRELGIGAEHTVAFGDYHNDLQMLDAAGISFAMANAHPDVVARARFVAPANTEHGVVATLHRLLGA